MTELLYMPSIEANYIKTFEAIVDKCKGDYVVLNRTAFYPEGGGQPSDTGTLTWSETPLKATVTKVVKKGIIKHILAPEPPASALPEKGTTVQGILDWDRRYQHMRMHTAQHLLSGVVYALFSANTVGNQIYSERSRVDFQPVSFSTEDLGAIESRCNEIINKGANVRIFEEKRKEYENRPEAKRLNLSLLPKAIQTLRVVEIPGVDAVPCAGTHVASVGDLRRVQILKRENKGKQTQRLIYTLDNRE